MCAVFACPMHGLRLCRCVEELRELRELPASICCPPLCVQARLRFRDLASLRALPFPALKISKRLAWPDSSWGVRLRCDSAEWAVVAEN